MEGEGKGVISPGKAFISHGGNRLYTSSHLSFTGHISKMCMHISYVSYIFGLFICLFI